MTFRIGITIGDVVERDGDLLGDGVNIAARLEGLAEVGGICVSRAVHEQVVNKLSVHFADIGAQEVKNIPTPVHAYMVAMRREDGSYAVPQVKKPAGKVPSAPGWMWPLAVAVVSIVAIGVGGLLYFAKLKQTSTVAAPPSAAPTAVAVAAPASAAAAPPAQPASSGAGEPFRAEAIPFVSDRARNATGPEYAAGTDYKALALNVGGFTGISIGQPNEEAARTAAVDLCQKHAESSQGQRRCEVYAVGNTVVYAHGRPPLPPMPWYRRDPLTERSFAAKDVPLIRDVGKARLDAVYVPARKSRSLAMAPGGQWFFNIAAESQDETVRRSLESCGAANGVACMIIAVDDSFVVPIPTLFRATGFFRAAANPSIIADARDDVARKLADAPNGWNAVAVGTAGRPGLGLKAADEQTAVNSALADCARHDSDCHVFAIGPYTVGPTN